LRFLRDLTKELNIFLIFDEVVTFRLAWGGAQSIYKVHPDITALGKTIGGGLPVGAFGASKEIMKVFSPKENDFISQSGTFNANPMTMVAGIACLKHLTIEVIDRINSLGDKLRRGMNVALSRAGIKGMATGQGSLAMTHLNANLVRDYRSAEKGNFQALLILHMKLLEKGIYVPPRGGEYSISSPMNEADVNTLIEAFEESLTEIRPFIEQTTPELLI
jgi:glutamate-1-semialdehyde 2,1-aminomutase